MKTLIAIAGILVLAIILWDGFEVIILPRRVSRRFRLSRTFYRVSWFVCANLGRRMKPRRRERFLSFFGPLSLLVLIVIWATGMVIAFAMVQWTFAIPGKRFAESLYMSGTTFITLGLGDVVPRTRWERFAIILEAGTGFGFLAMVISYLPVLYQAFSRREGTILLLDARAGSPPTASELFRRYGLSRGSGALDDLLREWEIWSADLLESYISFPVLAYFRSQHDNQSWLAALSTILDVCSVVLSGVDDLKPWQARLTFAMARHTVVDLAQIINAPPQQPQPDRLPQDALARLKEGIAGAGFAPHDTPEFDTKLARLREMYEPYVNALAGHLLINLSPWLRASDHPDNWRTSAWERSSTGLPPSLFDGDVHV